MTNLPITRLGEHTQRLRDKLLFWRVTSAGLFVAVVVLTFIK